jgi:hypothetical protein
MGRMYLTAIVVGLLPATLIGQTLERRLGGWTVEPFA